MAKKVRKTDITNYMIERSFGTKDLKELIYSCVENNVNHGKVLTTDTFLSYNTSGSVVGGNY